MLVRSPVERHLQLRPEGLHLFPDRPCPSLRTLRVGAVTAAASLLSAVAVAASAGAEEGGSSRAVPSASGTPTATLAASSANPLAGVRFYANPQALAHAAADRLRSAGRSADASRLDRLGATPTATWLGNWTSDVRGTTAKLVADSTAAGAVPVLVAYNIPHRDCGSYSAGGANSAAAYRRWIDGLAAGIGRGKAVVVIEPDALASLDCLSPARRNERYALLSYAATKLTARRRATVYLDGGNSTWRDPATTARRLRRAGVARTRGFALNVSNFNTTADEARFGNDVGARVGKHYVVDTSRNGAGSNGQWCNPAGRKIGVRPTSVTGRARADAYLWLKTPGESDGTCNGGPPAGEFWTEYALGLVG